MNNKKYTLICCLFVMAIIGNYAFARPDPRQVYCFQNIRLIQGAIEMYNMDYNPGIRHIEEDTIKKLMENGYIKKEPVKNDPKCEYKSIGNLEEDGIVFCKYHGDTNHLVYCDFYRYYKYDEYKKFSQNATDEEVKRNKEKIKNERIKLYNKIQNYDYLLSYGIPIIIFVLTVMIILQVLKSNSDQNKSLE